MTDRGGRPKLVGAARLGSGRGDPHPRRRFLVGRPWFSQRESPDVATSTATERFQLLGWLDQRDSMARGRHAAGDDSRVFEGLCLVVRSLLRSAVSEEQDVCASIVADLQRRSWLNDHDAARGQVETFRRLTEKHRERSFENAEDLFLNRLTVAATRTPRGVAPQVRLGRAQRGELPKLDHPSRWLLRVPTRRFEHLVFRATDRVAHGQQSCREQATTCWPPGGQWPKAPRTLSGDAGCRVVLPLGLRERWSGGYGSPLSLLVHSRSHGGPSLVPAFLAGQQRGRWQADAVAASSTDRPGLRLVAEAIVRREAVGG